MSNTNKEIYFKNSYMNKRIGGQVINDISNQSYLNNQLNLINESNIKLPPSNRFYNNLSGPYFNSNYQDNFNSLPVGADIANPLDIFPNKVTFNNDIYLRRDQDRYDPYVGFLYKNGLLIDGYQRRRLVTTVIDINSKFRNKNPKLQTEAPIQLITDPLVFTNNSNLVFINHINHNFQINDSISLTGVFYRSLILRTYRGTNLPTFEIKAGHNFMKIFFDHCIPLNYNGDSIKITLTGIKGDRGTNEFSSFLGSIPVNILNSTFSVKLSLTHKDTHDVINKTGNSQYFNVSKDYLFIILPLKMHNQTPPYTLNDYNFKIIFESLAGIPLNQINAMYPIDQNHLTGYHVIRATTPKGYTIQLISKALTNLNQGLATFNGGGNSVYVSKITEICPAYPNPNDYEIDLQSTFHNVVLVKLISSEIPNSQKVIRDFPIEISNNNLFWNNIDDGDFLYKICITPGNYDANSLANALEEAFSRVYRINKVNLSECSFKHIFIVTINTITDEVVFRSYKEYILKEPIIELLNEIDNMSCYKLTIYHPNHGITNPGIKIIIKEAIMDKGIPKEFINREHIVTEIIDENKYNILLPKLNLLPDQTSTGGGANVYIYVPDKFRLRFDQPNTLGNILGFRNVGELTSITNYDFKISNKDPYTFEVALNSLGQVTEIKNNSLQLNGDDYIIMVAKPLKTFYSVGPIKNGFAKILLCNHPGNVLFNTFVPMVHYYENPLLELYKLKISFFTPCGHLVDFNGVDHSFTLEIVEIHDIPDGTAINADTGKNYNPLII